MCDAVRGGRRARRCVGAPPAAALESRLPTRAPLVVQEATSIVSIIFTYHQGGRAAFTYWHLHIETIMLKRTGTGTKQERIDGDRTRPNVAS